jgi:hypothetical protein
MLGIATQAHCAINEINIKNIPKSNPITTNFLRCARVGSRPMSAADNDPISSDKPASTYPVMMTTKGIAGDHSSETGIPPAPYYIVSFHDLSSWERMYAFHMLLMSYVQF